MHAYNFIVSREKFTNFFCSTGNESLFITPFTACRHLCVPEIFAVKVESFLTLHQILDVLAFQNFKGVVPPQKLYPRYHPNLEAHQVAKYCVHSHYPQSYRCALDEI